MNSTDNNLSIPFSATSISVSSRFIFLYLLYKKKSTNSYSLLFCILSFISSCLWLQYSITINDIPIKIRSVADLILFTIAMFYIIDNKIKRFEAISQDELENNVENAHALSLDNSFVSIDIPIANAEIIEA